MSDAVKIRMASAANTADGVILTLKTTVGMEVSFLLDDVATSILALSLSPALKARLGTPPILFSKEEVK